MQRLHEAPPQSFVHYKFYEFSKKQLSNSLSNLSQWSDALVALQNSGYHLKQNLEDFITDNSGSWAVQDILAETIFGIKVLIYNN